MTDRTLAERFALAAPEHVDDHRSVWRARDLATSAAVRVVLVEAGTSDDDRLARSARLRHPVLPLVIAVGRDGTDAYAVTPLPDGVPLSQRIVHAGRMRSATAASLALPLAEGLALAHREGIAFGGFGPDGITLGDGATPVFSFLPLGPASEPTTTADLHGLADVLSSAVGAGDGIDVADRPDLSPRFVALVQSLQAAVPPTADEALGALRHLVDAETHAEASAPWEPFSAPLTTRHEFPPEPAPRRWRRLVVGVAVGAIALAGGATVGGFVAQREAAPVSVADLLGPAADETGASAPGITTIVLETATDSSSETGQVVVGPSTRSVDLPIARIRSFDSAGDGENDAALRRAIDGSPRTAWSTEVYRTENFGSKAGVGVILDLALPSEVRSLRIRSSPAGATVRVYVDRGPAPEGAPDGWTPAGRSVTLAERVTTVRVRRVPASTRVLLWITELPRLPTGGYAVEILTLEVRGVPAGA